jgi:hypothetical protein
MKHCYTAIAACLLAAALPAGADAPKTYSMTVHVNLIVNGEVDQVSRDGSKEAVEQTVNGQHNHLLYDFKAHKLYNKADNSACSVESYGDPAAPEPLDTVGGADFLKDLMAASPQLLGDDTVNGIAAKHYTASSKGQAEDFWVAEPQHVLVKAVTGAGKVLVEVENLSFAKPPAAALKRPHGC